jgi:DNA-binding ferritin-like protein (Dps family)
MKRNETMTFHKLWTQTVTAEAHQDLMELLDLVERAAHKAVQIADETGLDLIQPTTEALMDSHYEVAYLTTLPLQPSQKGGE